jgi:Kef-type K+ transport system membrane component KefB
VVVNRNDQATIYSIFWTLRQTSFKGYSMIKALLTISLYFLSNIAIANNTANTNVSSGAYDPVIFLWLVVFIFLSRSLSIVKKVGLPLVVGEILSGVILGDLNYFGISTFDNVETSDIIHFLAELGGVILMFEIGLESKISDLRKNFRIGFIVAIAGTTFTSISGFLISKYIIPEPTLARNLLFGIITAATATGISAKSFKEMKILRSKEVKIVLVASIIDELISIFCFGIISSLLLNSVISMNKLSISILQVLLFFIFAVVFGQWITPFLTKWSIKIHAGINMKIGVLLIVCFLFSWVAHKTGLATVIGAFVAGLMLDQVYFSSFTKSAFFQKIRGIAEDIEKPQTKDKLLNLIEYQESKNLEELLKPLSHLFVPVFFIYIGFMLHMPVFLQTQTLYLTGILLGVSFAGRIISGYLVKKKPLNRMVIGLGMTPIGEAGLIFAMFGKNLNIIDENTLAAIVATLVISSIITPILIKLAINVNGINV